MASTFLQSMSVRYNALRVPDCSFRKKYPAVELFNHAADLDTDEISAMLGVGESRKWLREPDDNVYSSER
jgi:hypothetical protein